jgi:heme A synthase
MYDISTIVPSLSFSWITLSPKIIWLAFYILVGIVAIITIVLTWHWRTYHPKPGTAYIATALFSIITALLLVGIASMIPNLFS